MNSIIQASAFTIATGGKPETISQMIRKLSYTDTDAIYDIINRAARAYKGAIPDDCYHEPYMPKEELQREMSSMTFFGWEEERRLVGVMGFQPVKDVTLIRHAYVLPDCQGKGIGTSTSRPTEADDQDQAVAGGYLGGCYVGNRILPKAGL